MMTKAKRSCKAKIYVLGNILLEEDNLPLKLLPKLKSKFPKINFIELDPTEEFPEQDFLILIDTIKGLKGVKIFEEIDKIKLSPNYSVHDFDLGFQLKLMKKLGTLKKVLIIGVGQKVPEEEAEKKLEKIISNLLLKNG